MFSSNVPKNFWGEAVLTAGFLINRVPSKVLNYFTPSKILQKFYPQNRLLTDISPRILGCTIFIHVYSHNRSKLDPKSIKGIFIRYSPNKKGYKCYCPSSRRFFHSMDVTFFENTLFFPKTAIQGGISNQETEYLFLDTRSLKVIQNFFAYQIGNLTFMLQSQKGTCYQQMPFWLI